MLFRKSGTELWIVNGSYFGNKKSTTTFFGGSCFLYVSQMTPKFKRSAFYYVPLSEHLKRQWDPPSGAREGSDFQNPSLLLGQEP
jgi:hypothetical protein